MASFSSGNNDAGGFLLSQPCGDGEAFFFSIVYRVWVLSDQTCPEGLSSSSFLFCVLQSVARALAPKAPLLDGHVRSEILLGVTILRPAKGDPTRTEMTTVRKNVCTGTLRYSWSK